MKKAIALAVIRWRFEDTTLYTHAEPRIAAIVAAVPYTADFDVGSLAAPRVPLALVTARQDKWLLPRFHSDRVLKACATCERLVDFPNGGHGAPLSPLPPGKTGLAAELMNDPPGFEPLGAPRDEPQDRCVLPQAPAPRPATSVSRPRMIEFGRGIAVRPSRLHIGRANQGE